MQVVARELGVDASEVASKLELLQTLVPDLSPSLGSLKPAELARLAASLDDGVAQRLILLRDALPSANISAVVASNRALLTEDTETVARWIAEVKALLGVASGGGGDNGAALDALIEASPMLLQPEALQQVLAEVQRLFGSAEPAALLLAQPDLAHLCQSLRQQSRGERDADYLASIFRASS